MPDRSKKRKKNKNKRKAKNNPQNGQNSKVTDASPDAGSCDESVTSEVNESALTESCGDLTQSECHSEPVLNESKISEIQSGSKSEIANNNCVDHKTEPVSICEPVTVKYIVESPEQLKICEKIKLSEIPKSKSLDGIDAPKIVDITEDGEIKSDDEPALGLIDSNALVSEAESDVEWEMADGLVDESMVCQSAKAVGTLSITTLPLNIAECEHTQALSPEEELSLRQYLQTLNLVTCPQEVAAIEVEKIDISRETDTANQKLRKKAIAEDVCKTKPTIPRFLEVIDEEGSNESSLTSRRQSYLKDEYDDLEDDVFHDKNKKSDNCEKFPLPKSVRPQVHNKTSHLIPQECLLVGAKIMEPKIDGGCGEWTVQNVEKMTGAEVVYLTDSSSSASDIYDIGEEPENGDETDDSTVRIITPTIEVNNSQNFLRNTTSETMETDVTSTDQFITNNTTKTPPSSPQIVISDDSCSEEADRADATGNDSNNEIIVLSTENKNPLLYVLRIDEDDLCDKENIHNTTPIDQHAKSPEKIIENIVSSLPVKDYAMNEEKEKTHFTLNEPKCKIDTEINDLKLELNNAISNLMKEVAAEKDNNQLKENTLSRQDSSSSVGSSQCTAKYNPTTSSLTDIATLVHETTDPSKSDIQNRPAVEPKESHVKDVFERVAGSASEANTAKLNERPILLKDLCVRRIASLPYGEKILEELASVSERLQNINIYGNTGLNFDKMPFYPLPDVSSIKKVALPTKCQNTSAQKKLSPPPVAPRNSSLKIPHDELAWTGIPTKRDPSLYVCLSPSQKMLIEKTNTIIDKDDASELLDTHHKYVDRRGYNEVYSGAKKTENLNKNYNDALPFKSQTGNRLLAIIRDPSINCNSNTKINKWNNFRENLNHSSSYINNRSEDEITGRFHSNSAKDLRSESTFKPIPPPRPRKYSSAIYESDESSDFTDHSFQSISERKYFHYSTGNLNKEIEKDISSIQDMHRKYTSARDTFKNKCLLALEQPTRRPSLPRDICEQQMEYIRRKEKEVEAEIRRLELDKSNQPKLERRGPRAPLYSESNFTEERKFEGNNYHISRKRDVALHSNNNNQNGSKQISSSFKSSQEEIMRDKMYSEYMCQMAEREERKQHKIIKITTNPLTNDSKITSASLPVLNHSNEPKVGNNLIEEEFISKAKERWDKLGIKDPETEDEREKKDEYHEPKVIEHKIKVIEGGEEKDLQRLPSHLREFVQFTASGKGERGETSSGESTAGGASLFVVICAVVIVMLAIGKRMIPFFRDNSN